MSSVDIYLPAISAFLCFALAVAVFFLKSRSVVRWSFAVGMVLLGNELLLSTMGSAKLREAEKIYQKILDQLPEEDSDKFKKGEFWLFSANEISALYAPAADPALAERPIDVWLRDELTPEPWSDLVGTRSMRSIASSEVEALVRALNGLVRGPLLDETNRLEGITLGPTTVVLLKAVREAQEEIGPNARPLLNSLVLRDAYPRRLSPLDPPSEPGGIGTDFALHLQARFDAAKLEFDPVRVDAANYQYGRLLVLAFLPGTWLLFSLSYSRGNYREFLRRSRWALACGFLVPLVFGLGAVAAGQIPLDQLTKLSGSHLSPFDYNGFGFGPHLSFGVVGAFLNVFLVIGFVLILLNLERTFRASVGTLRWRVKYTVLGLSVILGMKLYESVVSLVQQRVTSDLVPFESAALLLGCGLVVYSVARSRLAEIDLYPSHAFLRNSITFILGFVYLLIVGLLAKGLGLSESAARLNSVVAFGVLLAVVGLSVLLLSDRVRRWTRAFVSRHLRRPFYDYRRIWSSFTEQTSSSVDEAGFCRAVARHLSQIFEALSVTLWLVNEDRGELQFASSTSLSEEDSRQLASALPKLAEIEPSVREHRDPLDMDRSEQAWAQLFQRCNPDQFDVGGRRVCVPLVSGGELMGLAVLGDRVSGVQFSPEDLQLLRSIGDQVAAGLRNIRLSQRLVRAKELEAFQTMSAFVVHDLKNTASTLSLMLQNMAVHFDDPQFRTEASRALGKSVAHLNELIARLGTLRQKLELKPVPADLNRVVESALGAWPGDTQVTLTRELGALPSFQFDPAQVEKVVTNLVLNARDAVEQGGRVRVETRRSGRWALLAVVDDGRGMTPEFVQQSLFKPFKTTKQKGLGIGLFHCKMIVEAHRGRIEVETQPGAGTTFRVLLPMEGTNP